MFLEITDPVHIYKETFMAPEKLIRELSFQMIQFFIAAFFLSGKIHSYNSPRTLKQLHLIQRYLADLSSYHAQGKRFLRTQICLRFFLFRRLLQHLHTDLPVQRFSQHAIWFYLEKQAFQIVIHMSAYEYNLKLWIFLFELRCQFNAVALSKTDIHERHVEIPHILFRRFFKLGHTVAGNSPHLSSQALPDQPGQFLQELLFILADQYIQHHNSPCRSLFPLLSPSAADMTEYSIFYFAGKSKFRVQKPSN